MTEETYAGLTQLGHHVEQPADARTRRSWSAWRTRRAGKHYVVRFTCPEFTSLCPITGQPDFAHIVIDYIPRDWIVESKSLKLFLAVVPQPRRLPRGLHDGDRASGWWRCWIRSGCASAATGIRAAACRSTCSGRPARRRRAPGSRRRTWRPTVGAAEFIRPLADPKALIRDRALALGFDAVGFCRAELGAEARAAAGRIPRRRPARRHGLARRPRPSSAAIRATLWPEARSVIALGLSYAPDDDPLATLAHRRSRHHLGLCPQPRLSRRGQGHAEAPRAVHRRALRARGEGVRRYRAGDGKAAGGARRASAGRASTPTWSRARTARGCSWARSTPRSTSPPDEPHADRCGTCTRCLDVCPTDAFPAPYRLDATRCISYLTIEHHGPIPHELRPLMGNRIYGCDDCLAVCPWNRFAARHAARQAARPRRPDGAAPRRTGRPGRRRLPHHVRRVADQAHRPRPLRAQRADRHRQLRRSRSWPPVAARLTADREPGRRRGGSLGMRATGSGASHAGPRRAEATPASCW